MSELQAYASQDKFLVFDGKTIHKRAFRGKGKASPSEALLVAGKVSSEVSADEVQYIISRMRKVKQGFKYVVETYVENWWVQNAKKMGMVSLINGKMIDTYKDLVEELESNSKMESFQNWYNVCYKENEIKGHAKLEAEGDIMKGLNLTYHDNTVSKGCVLELVSEVMSKMLEQIQSKSRYKQGLHLTKSRPSKKLEETNILSKGTIRRDNGCYYIIRSDRMGRFLDFESYNVSCHSG
jgi:hypothetical protein